MIKHSLPTLPTYLAYLPNLFKTPDKVQCSLLMLCSFKTPHSVLYSISAFLCRIRTIFYKLWWHDATLFCLFITSLFAYASLRFFSVCKVFYSHTIPNVGFVRTSSSAYMFSHSMGSIIVVFSKELFFPFKGKT